MSLRWDRLRVLHEVAQEESITAAADMLHLTGPAVSAQIRALEREVGVALIERDGRGIRLTGAGHVLAGHAATLTRQVQLALQEVTSLRDEVAGPLRLGAVNATMRELVRPWSWRSRLPTRGSRSRRRMGRPAPSCPCCAPATSTS